jgi:outer membrane receptor protein involved in Fe transport
MEWTRSDAHLLTSGLTTGQSYAGAYPSLHVDRALSDTQTISFGASRRISRPDPSALNPYVDRQDTQNLRAGNPNLLPQDTQSYEAGYSVETREQSYALTAYFRRNHNSVTDLTKVVSADVVEATKVNLPKNDSGGLEFTSNGRLNAQIHYGLSGNLFYSQIDATALGAPGLQSTVGLNAKVNLDYRPTAADTGQIALTRSDKRLTPQGHVDAINLVNLGYKRQLRSDLAAVATISDVFNGQTLIRRVNTPGLIDTYERHVGGRICYLGLVYTFGSKSGGDAESFDFDQ